MRIRSGRSSRPALSATMHRVGLLALARAAHKAALSSVTRLSDRALDVAVSWKLKSAWLPHSEDNSSTSRCLSSETVANPATALSPASQHAPETGNNQSGGKQYAGRTRRGSTWLKTWLTEAAQRALTARRARPGGSAPSPQCHGGHPISRNLIRLPVPYRRSLIRGLPARVRARVHWPRQGCRSRMLKFGLTAPPVAPSGAL